jgi:hypothetical protein
MTSHPVHRPASPLRARMIEDMSERGFSPKQPCAVALGGYPCSGLMPQNRPHTGGGHIREVAFPLLPDNAAARSGYHLRSHRALYQGSDAR